MSTYSQAMTVNTSLPQQLSLISFALYFIQASLSQVSCSIAGKNSIVINDSFSIPVHNTKFLLLRVT